MELEITPHLGVGRVTFQMTKAEVQHVLGVATREFLRSEDSVGPEWEYRNRGIIVSFDATGVCDSLQLSDPCDPVLQGVHLLSMG